jgi:aminopeptidase-like protein
VNHPGSQQTTSLEIGAELQGLIAELYPICRSITGDGLRQTLLRLGRELPLEVREVRSGTQLFDWTVPREWNIVDAYVKDPAGRRVIDFRASNLHVLNYSIPVRTRLSLSELRKRLSTVPEHPDWIPYRTSYYREDWGFCLSQATLDALEEGDYEVCIDSTLVDGSLSYGEVYIAGETSDEVLISAHACHPSLCNDNLSGVAVAALLARTIDAQPRRLSYRFLFAPGTIGAIAWLFANQAGASRIKHGLVLACVGDRGRVTYKRSRSGGADIDRAVMHVLRESGDDYELLDFSPVGYDERQYGSPGFDLPVGCFMRTPPGWFPEYHTSADDLEFVDAESLADSFDKLLAALSIVDRDGTYVNLNPMCEPQLGRRGLYRAIGGKKEDSTSEEALLWVLNLSDSCHTLLDIAERSGLAFGTIRAAADTLIGHDLLKAVA